MTETPAAVHALPQIADRQTWQAKTGGQFRLGGRPTAQWSRINAGRSDDLGDN